MASEQALSESVRAYALAKFRLDEKDVESSNLEDLAQASLAKMLRIAPELVGEETDAPNCDGASTIDVKQALLLAALQRDYDVALSGHDIAFAETLEGVARIMWQRMLAKG